MGKNVQEEGRKKNTRNIDRKDEEKENSPYFDLRETVLQQGNSAARGDENLSHKSLSLPGLMFPLPLASINTNEPGARNNIYRFRKRT